ncbi:MAG: hypothetical protein WC341_17970, partial [Bacteroidales bacterium]
MTMILTQQAEQRVEDSLVTDDNGRNEYQRAILFIQNGITNSKASIDDLAQKDEINEGVWNYTLNILQKYWEILHHIYGYSFIQETQNTLSSPFLNPEFPTKMLNDSVLIASNFSSLDLSVLDAGSFGKTYLTNFTATKPQYQNFFKAWFPFDVAGIRRNSSLPYKGPYFKKEYNGAQTYIAAPISPVPPAPPLWEWTDLAPSTETSRFCYGKLSKSIVYVNGLPISPSDKTSLIQELSLEFTADLRNTIALLIDNLASLLTEIEHASKISDLFALKTVIETYSNLLTDYTAINSGLDSTIPLVEAGMNYFIDKFYYYFIKRS